MTFTTFAQKLKNARQNYKLTQKRLAECLEVSQKSIEQWETGNRAPLKIAQEGALHRLLALTVKSKNTPAPPPRSARPSSSHKGPAGRIYEKSERQFSPDL